MSENIAPNAARVADVTSAEDYERVRRDRDEADLRWMLSDARGRRFLAGVLYDRTHVLRTSFDQSAISMAANEGERNVGLELLAWIEVVDFHGALRIRQERYEEALLAASITTAARQKAQGEPTDALPTIDEPIS